MQKLNLSELFPFHFTQQTCIWCNVSGSFKMIYFKDTETLHHSNACLLSATDINWESPATWAALHLSHLLPLAKLKSACLTPLWREKLHSCWVLYPSLDAGFIFYHFWQMQRSNSRFWISSKQYMYKLKSKYFGWIENSNFLPLQTSWLTVSCWLTYLSLNGG